MALGVRTSCNPMDPKRERHGTDINLFINMALKDQRRMVDKDRRLTDLGE
jgi:hypothetical protein